MLHRKMTPNRMRPVGVALLAIVFLWIGGFGTIFFPLIAFWGGTGMLWQQIAGGVIHSKDVLKITSYLFSSIWFLLYVAYLFIGIGLWRLRNWARRAQLALFKFCVIFCVLVLPFLVKPPVMAVGVVAGTAVPFAAMAWYLQRPRVRYAFGNWPVVAGPPPALSKTGKAYVVTAIAASFALFTCSLAFSVESSFRDSPIYALTLQQAQSSPCVTAVLGAPLTPDWNTQGDLSDGSSNGSANLEISVHGPKGKGNLVVKAKKQKGSWEIDSLVLRQGSAQKTILPATSASACQ